MKRKTPVIAGKYRVTFWDDSTELRAWWDGLWWSAEGHSLPGAFIKSWESVELVVLPSTFVKSWKGV